MWEKDIQIMKKLYFVRNGSFIELKKERIMSYQLKDVLKCMRKNKERFYVSRKGLIRAKIGHNTYCPLTFFNKKEKGTILKVRYGWEDVDVRGSYEIAQAADYPDLKSVKRIRNRMLKAIGKT